jgi:hypothetical protein
LRKKVSTTKQHNKRQKMVKTVVVPEPSALDKVLEEQVQASTASGHPLFVYVIGARDAAGKSWCPDCVACKYTLFSLFKSSIYKEEKGKKKEKKEKKK